MSEPPLRIRIERYADGSGALVLHRGSQRLYSVARLWSIEVAQMLRARARWKEAA
jgi:hypothetical protein